MRSSRTAPRVLNACLALAVIGLLAALTANYTVQAAGVDSKDERELARLDDDWSETAATKDAEKVASFYADRAVAYPPNEPIAVGRDAAKKVWAGYFADPNFVSISWKTDHAEVATSGELGFTTGKYVYSFKGPDGKRQEQKGKYVCAWKKQADGSWKAVHDIWNADSK